MLDKLISKEIFLKCKIRTPKFFSIFKKKFKREKINKKIKLKKIHLPIIVKPISEGSSIGVKLCKTKNILFKSINQLFGTYDDLIIEEYIGAKKYK